VLADGTSIDTEKFGHAALAEPEGLILEEHFDPSHPVGRLVENDLAFARLVLPVHQPTPFLRPSEQPATS